MYLSWETHAHRVLIVKFLGEWLLGRPICREESNI
jgi:hypothetical protein